MAKSIAVVSPSFDFVDGQSLVTKESVRIIRTHHKVHEFIYRRGFYPFDFLKRFISFLIKLKKFDTVYIVISRSLVGQFRDLPYLLVAALSDKKISIHVHGNDFDKLNYLRLLKLLKKNQIRFICCTSQQFNFFSSLGYSASILYNFIMDARLIDLGLVQRRRNSVLFLSNLILSKGPVNTILSVKMLNRYNAQFRLQVVGNIPEKMRYKGLNNFEKWRKLFECEAVSIIGPVYSREGLGKLFTRNDIFCFPSHYATEANPLVLIEAACNGMKIVAYDRNIFKSLLSGYSCVVYVAKALPSVIANALIEVSEMSIDREEVELLRERYSVNYFQKDLLKLQ